MPVTAGEYVRQVEFELRDLPWRQRRDLVAELQAHLAEFPPDADLVERLGTPERYAAEMRAAAGLERRHGPIAYLRARRPRNLVLTAIAVVLIGLAIGTLAWIQRYQPITDGSFGQTPLNAKLAVGQDLYEVPFHQGRRFAAGLSIENDGRFTVHVTGIEPFAPYLPLKDGALYVAGPAPEDRYPWAPLHRFHPFDLAPGQGAFVFLRGTFEARCHAVRPGGQSFWTLWEFDVHFGFLWHRSTTKIAFPTPIQIDSPKGQICDSRPWQHPAGTAPSRTGSAARRDG